MRVVVVDDSPDDRAEVRRLLVLGSPRPWEFVEAATGGAGIQAILTAPGGLPDCVILDYRLPDIDAPEVLAALMGPDEGPLCPVVVVTGDDARDSGRAVLWAGAQDYVGKPWMTSASLARAVENAMERWAMTRELGASAARLRLAVEASKTGIWRWDVATNAVTWTPECYEVSGVPESAGGETLAVFQRIIHPDDFPRVVAAIEAAIADHGLFRSEFRVVRPDGEIRWVEDLGRASYDADERPVAMLGTLTDITARKRAEEILATRERELRSLTDNTPDVIARFDRELRHVFINATVERLSGRPAAEFLGKTNRELGMPSDLQATWDTALRSVFETGEAVSVEFEAPMAGGRSYDSRMVPERGPDGEIAFVLAVAHDVTDRKRAENALRESEQRSARAQRAACIGIWDWDLVAGTGTWTEETWRLFDRVPFSEPVTRAMWLDSIHPDDREAAVALGDAGFGSGTHRQELRVLRRGGEVRWIEATGEIEVSADGRPVRMVGTVRDVTARHQADEALRGALAEAQLAVRARDDLVSLVSHDLKSPLTTLVMGIAILESRLHEEDRTILERMARQAQRMSRMVDELLDVARLRAGMPLDLDLRGTDLVAITRAQVDEHAQASPAHRIELHAAVKSLVGIWDARRIDRVVNNLLSNAIKYSPGGTTVRVDLESVDDAKGRWASLRITDEGIGISPGDRDLMFQWFSRGENARRMTRDGTGIGLAGSRDIVEQHGGKITVESEEGKGSAFTVKLPLGSALAPEDARSGSGAPLPGRGE